MLGNTTASGWLNEAEIILHRMRSFHRERVETIHKDESHVRLSDPYRLIVHLLPEEAVRSPKAVSVAELKRGSQAIRPLGERSGYSYRHTRYNADGLLLYDGQEAVRGYSQPHRSRVFEGVMAGAVFQQREDKDKVLREDSCDDAIIGALSGYLPFAKALALESPLWMFVALVGCEGARICTDRTAGVKTGTTNSATFEHDHRSTTE